MRWKNREGSENVEDRRGKAPAAGMALGGGGIGLLLIFMVVKLLAPPEAQQLVRDLEKKLVQPGQAEPFEAGRGDVATDPAEAELAQFVSVVLRDTEEVWTDLFAKNGNRYEKPTLVLFRGRDESACGIADAGMGPFYCPADRQVYLDLSFYKEMEKKLGAPGDFAQAYVIAHEVGHHVQNLLGISSKVHQDQRRMKEVEANQLSVRLELQADFFAGVWAHHAQKKFQFLEPGDLEEALNCASAIGDDTLQKRAKGYANQETFTHGSAQQRMKWFRLGLQTGDMNQGNTFEARSL